MKDLSGGADCDTDHNLVVAKVRDRLVLSTEATQKFYVGKKNLRKLNKLEVRKYFRIKISNRFAALDIEKVDINRAWEYIKENIKTQLKRV